MTQISILSGIKSTLSGDVNASYPVNIYPVIEETGISSGYLRTADGLIEFTLFIDDILGVDRGGVNWNGDCYRVIGQHFIKVKNDGVVDKLGILPIGGYVRFDFSFDRLAIACSGNLYYWNGTTLAQVTDPDLGFVSDMIWIDGYFMSTDGETFVVTDLNNPFNVNPLKYGAIDSDQSEIVGLLKVRDEAHAISRYVISPLQNVGGSGFPFNVVKGAIVQKGAIGTRAACVYNETIAFLGSGRNEEPSIYVIGGGNAIKIATKAIEHELSKYTENELSETLMETRSHSTQSHLYIHLKNITMVYDSTASEIAGQPVWFYLSSSHDGAGAYRARNFVWCYNKWLCGDLIDARKIGYLTRDIASQYDDYVGYRFDTPILYSEGRGAILTAIELVSTTGVSIKTEDDFKPQSIRRSYTLDGITYSQPKEKSLGKAGETRKRPLWLRCGMFRNWRIERFEGLTKVPVSFLRLEVDIEGLNE